MTHKEYVPIPSYLIAKAFPHDRDKTSLTSTNKLLGLSRCLRNRSTCEISRVSVADCMPRWSLNQRGHRIIEGGIRKLTIYPDERWLSDPPQVEIFQQISFQLYLIYRFMKDIIIFSSMSK